MPTFRLTHAAEQNLAEIWWYVALDSPSHADNLIHRLHEVFITLADFPNIGVVWSPDTHPEVRRFPVGNYLIFYRPEGFGVSILRVLHGSRDVRSIVQGLE